MQTSVNMKGTMRKKSFQMCVGIRSLYIEIYKKFSLHIVFVTFCFMDTLASRHKMLECLKKYGIQHSYK